MVTFLWTHPRLLIELVKQDNTTNLSPIKPNVFFQITLITGNISDPESIYHHLRSTKAPDFDRETIDNAITKVIKLNEIVNLKTLEGLDSLYVISQITQEVEFT